MLDWRSVVDMVDHSPRAEKYPLFALHRTRGGIAVEGLLKLTAYDFDSAVYIRVDKILLVWPNEVADSEAGFEGSVILFEVGLEAKVKEHPVEVYRRITELEDAQ